jgi:hypothetical protein
METPQEGATGPHGRFAFLSCASLDAADRRQAVFGAVRLVPPALHSRYRIHEGGAVVVPE